jgi:hypothetical protein
MPNSAITPVALEVAGVYADAALHMAAQRGISAVRGRIVELARKTLDCQAAVLWQLAGPGAVTVAATSDVALGARLIHAVHETGEGPTLECLNCGQPRWFNDLGTEQRWPRYRDRLLATTDIGSGVGYPLSVNGNQLGALTMYCHQTDRFCPTTIAAGAMFAIHCALALHSANGWDRAEQLAAAQTSNRRIGMAIGIIIANHQMTEQQAFDVLRIASQHRNQKLHQVADEVLLTGATPT